MHIYVINLDRSTARLDEFHRANSHLPAIHRFSAVDGSALDRDELVTKGVIAPGLPYSNGALGCAMSHLFFWEAASSQTEVITVVEDDAILHREFARKSQEILDSLPPDWDLAVWGWNFDSILMIDLLPGISQCLCTFDQEGLRKGTQSFRERQFTASAHRLLRCFGTVAYTISPAGSQKLRNLSLPIAPFEIAMPMVNPRFPNNGIDIVMNRAYPLINAFVSFPPLAITKNEHENSTVQGLAS